MSTAQGTRGRTRHEGASLGLLGLGLWCVVAMPARGEESVYCRKVHARAAEDAALFLWPKLLAEAVRFPSYSEALGPTLGSTGIQVRLGVSISPTDMVRGARIDRAADAACELHEAAQALEQVLLESADEATLAGLKGQAEFLRGHRAEWEALVEQASERLRAGVITILELQALRRSVIELERKLALVTSEIERLERQRTRPRPRPSGTMGLLAERYISGAMRLEREAAVTRALDALHVGVTGGLIPGLGRPSEWYGLLVVSYQLGGLFGAPSSSRYLAARQEELEHAPYELPAKASDARLGLGGQMAKAWRELQVVESELATNKVTLGALASSQATIAEHARATVSIEQFSLESDRTYLSGLIDSLSRLSP